MATNNEHPTRPARPTSPARPSQEPPSSPPAPPRIVLPHGGYKNLLAFRKSDVVYQGTVVFCRRFLPEHGDRTVDQMVQAARSCKQNIAEGSAASGTSKETEIKLTNVARASLEELLEDYHDYLVRNGLALWDPAGDKHHAARDFAKTRNDWPEWQALFESRSAETLANLMLVIGNQTSYLLGRVIERQEADFTQHGGIRERMHAARTTARGAMWHAALHDFLAEARSPEDLAARQAELRRETERIARNIARDRGWQQ